MRTFRLNITCKCTRDTAPRGANLNVAWWEDFADTVAASDVSTATSFTASMPMGMDQRTVHVLVVIWEPFGWVPNARLSFPPFPAPLSLPAYRPLRPLILTIVRHTTRPTSSAFRGPRLTQLTRCQRLRPLTFGAKTLLSQRPTARGRTLCRTSLQTQTRWRAQAMRPCRSLRAYSPLPMRPAPHISTWTSRALQRQQETSTSKLLSCWLLCRPHRRAHVWPVKCLSVPSECQLEASLQPMALAGSGMRS